MGPWSIVFELMLTVNVNVNVDSNVDSNVDIFVDTLSIYMLFITHYGLAIHRN